MTYIILGDFFMSKKDEFKHFASSHPELNEYVRKGDMTWQKFYEMYDIYGEDNRGWDKYLTSTNSENKISSKKGEKPLPIPTNQGGKPPLKTPTIKGQKKIHNLLDCL